MTFTCCWLGVAGLSLTMDGFTLLVDPFFTRPGKLAVARGARIQPNAALVARYAPYADAILVTHPHYDHLLDVPVIAQRSGAQVYGSPNTCALVGVSDIPSKQRTCIVPGDVLRLGPFTVEVFPARHVPLPRILHLDGPLPEQGRRLRAPLRLSDYRMDASYSFRVRAGTHTLMVGNHAAPADVLFFAPYHPPEFLAHMLHAVQPAVIVPIHWEDFMRPLDQPLVPMLLTRAQGLRGFRPIGRANLQMVTAVAQSVSPHTRLLMPHLFEPLPIG